MARVWGEGRSHRRTKPPHRAIPHALVVDSDAIAASGIAHDCREMDASAVRNDDPVTGLDQA